jgi:hypothetical protein
MANDTTSERVWVLDTVGVITAKSNSVLVRKVHFFPTTAADELLIQDYGVDASATLRTAIYAKTAPSVVAPIEIDFGPSCFRLNGFKLATITHGSVVVYLGRM